VAYRLLRNVYDILCMTPTLFWMEKDKVVQPYSGLFRPQKKVQNVPCRKILFAKRTH
jgi:hypothetical protein